MGQHSDQRHLEQADDDPRKDPSQEKLAHRLLCNYRVEHHRDARRYDHAHRRRCNRNASRDFLAVASPLHFRDQHRPD